MLITPRHCRNKRKKQILRRYPVFMDWESIYKVSAWPKPSPDSNSALSRVQWHFLNDTEKTIVKFIRNHRRLRWAKAILRKTMWEASRFLISSRIVKLEYKTVGTGTKIDTHTNGTELRAGNKSTHVPSATIWQGSQEHSIETRRPFDKRPWENCTGTR